MQLYLTVWAIVFFLKPFATDRAGPESFCQLSACSLLRSSPISILPQQFPLCSSAYRGIDMRPIAPQKFQLSPKGRHIFDLFYDPAGFQCNSVSVFVDLNDRHLDIFFTVSCGDFNFSTGIAFVSLDLWSERCVRLYDTEPDFSRKCGYHQVEQLRFTIVDNGTLLMEDLSPMVPPGTRIIFRAGHHQNQSRSCRCRNVQQENRSYKMCQKCYKWLHEELSEFLLGLGLVLGAMLAVIIGLWWATHVRNYQRIEVT